MQRILDCAERSVTMYAMQGGNLSTHLACLPFGPMRIWDGKSSVLSMLNAAPYPALYETKTVDVFWSCRGEQLQRLQVAIKRRVSLARANWTVLTPDGSHGSPDMVKQTAPHR